MAVDDLLALLTAGVGNLLGDIGDAVVRAQREHVVLRADLRVEMLEQLADRRIETDQHVLHLVAARPEGVAGGIQRREAHAKEIGRGLLSQLERVDGLLRHLLEVLVGER